MCSEVPGVVTGKLEATRSTNSKVSHSVDGASDFVWAIRLAKISKGILDTTWTPETYSRGATFGMKEHRAKIQDILSEEGVEATEIVPTNRGGALILQGVK